MRVLCCVCCPHSWIGFGFVLLCDIRATLWASSFPRSIFYKHIIYIYIYTKKEEHIKQITRNTMLMMTTIYELRRGDYSVWWAHDPSPLLNKCPEHPCFFFFYLTKQIDKEMHYNISHAPSPPSPTQTNYFRPICVRRDLRTEIKWITTKHTDRARARQSPSLMPHISLLLLLLVAIADARACAHHVSSP